MIRTIISLDPGDKHWLDRRAEEENVTMTQLVRRAIRRYREECEAEVPSLERLLEATAGLWKEGDGLDYQLRLRAEWDEEER
jgi:Ribbon-helix-helix protein, copG family